MKAVLDRLREARQNCGMRAEDAIQYLPDISSNSALSQWETGRRRLTVDRLLQLCEVYNVDVMWVLTGQDCAETTSKMVRVEEHIRHLMALIEDD